MSSRPLQIFTILVAIVFATCEAGYELAGPSPEDLAKAIRDTRGADELTYGPGPSAQDLANAILGTTSDGQNSLTGHSRGVVISNLALHKPARQSSDFQPTSKAGNAVDGNSDGNFGSKSVTHTRIELGAWWEVDLQLESKIFSVYLFNRIDCCLDRLTNFDVMFYDYAYRLVTSVHYGNDVLTAYGFGMQPPVLARYVRVQLRDENPLSLAEVQVLGHVLQAHENVAYLKPASQSSTYSNVHKPTADKAVDGNTDGVFPSASTTHTNNDVGAWWKVDLEREYDITAITLYNRVDCCSARLQNFDISLFDASKNKVHVIPYGTGVKDILPFSVSPSKGARYVEVKLRGQGFLSLAEVRVFARMVNLAIHKPARQSSTYSTKDGPAIAARAVDGNTDGNFNALSVTHTKKDSGAWWEVDLGHQSKIFSIFLFNRVDCCKFRLSNFEVQLFDYSHWLVKTVSQNDEVKVQYDFDFQAGVEAQYVRIVLKEQQFLSLAEVQVYGVFLGGYENVAYQKPAIQSSLYNPTPHATADKAVDGNTDGIFSVKSTTHTQNDASAWWQVDLGNQFHVTAVTIYNRVDCCSARLQNFDIILFDSHGVEVKRLHHGDGDQPIYVFKLSNSPTFAQFVKVQLTGTNYLQLAEVQVFSGQKTCSGNAHGQRCFFPFTYGGKVWNSCMVDADHSAPWCATQGGVVTGRYKWGYCRC